MNRKDIEGVSEDINTAFDTTMRVITTAREEQSDFIFRIISPFCSRIIEHEISKEELTFALTKQNPMKPVPDGFRELCPSCGASVLHGHFNGREFENKYCARCGQRIDFNCLL